MIDLQELLNSGERSIQIPPGVYVGDFVVPAHVRYCSGAGRGVTNIMGTLSTLGGIWGKPVQNVSGMGLYSVMNKAPGSWSKWRPEYRAGEFWDGVSPLYDQYNGPTFITPLESAFPFTLANLTVTQFDNAFQPAIQIKQRQDVHLYDVEASGSNWATIDIQRCYNVKIDSIFVHCYKPAAQTTIAEYGLCIHNSQNVSVSKSYLSALRHAISVAGDSLDHNIVNRNIVVYDCDLMSYGTGPYGNIQSMHIHGNCEYWNVSKCRIWNGIVVSGDKGIVDRNIIFGRPAGQASIGIYFSECLGTTFDITRNQIETYTVPYFSDTYGGLFGFIGDNTARDGITKLYDNEIRSTKPLKYNLWNSHASKTWNVSTKGNFPVDSLVTRGKMKIS